MRNKFLFSIMGAAILAIASLCSAQDATYQTKIYTDSGGDQLNVASGGSVTVHSGGVVDLKTGALLKDNGTTVFGAGTVWAVAKGGTGTNTAAGARSNLGAAASGANSDITSIAGLTTPLTLAQGGVGTNTAAGARDNLGFDFVTQSVTGTASVSTSLGTVSVCVASLETIGTDTGHVQAVPSGGSVNITVTGIGTTTVSTTPVDVHIFAGGTP